MKRAILFLLSLLLLTPALMLASCDSKSDFIYTRRTEVPGESDSRFGSYTYHPYDDGTVVIKTYDGSEAVVNIPDSLNGQKVTAIGVSAFISNKTITTLKIPDTVETIGEYAFFDCSALSDIEFGNRLWDIGAAAFEATPWLSAQTDEFLIVGDSVLLKYQGTQKAVTVPDNIKHLSYAFCTNTDIIKVITGDSLYTIGQNAFTGCESLCTVTIGKNVRAIDDHAFEGCTALVFIDIPDSVTYIGDNAFTDCRYLSSAHIGNSVTKMGTYAFMNCLRIHYITIPASLTSIGGNAFADCPSLTLVRYGGTEEQFKALAVGGTNSILNDVEKLYGGTDETK